MQEYSKTRLLKNIAYMMRVLNLKVGEVEAAANVSPGYFSRLKNNENEEAAPSIDTLSLIGKTLGISLNTLLYCDFTELTETELFIQKFLTQMLDQTSNKVLLWEKETENYVLNSWNYDESQRCHPLMTHDLNEIGDPRLVYNSLFTDDFCELAGSVYRLDRINQKFFITKIKHWNKENAYCFEYELYIYKSGKLNKVCNATLEGKEELVNLLHDLYQAAEASSKTLKIDDSVKKGLEEFLSGDDDKLPF